MKRKDLLKDVIELLQRQNAMKSYLEVADDETRDSETRKQFTELYEEECQSFKNWLEEEVEFPPKEIKVEFIIGCEYTTYGTEINEQRLVTQTPIGLLTFMRRGQDLYQLTLIDGKDVEYEKNYMITKNERTNKIKDIKEW